MVRVAESTIPVQARVAGHVSKGTFAEGVQHICRETQTLKTQKLAPQKQTLLLEGPCQRPWKHNHELLLGAGRVPVRRVIGVHVINLLAASLDIVCRKCHDLTRAEHTHTHFTRQY